MLFRSGDNDPTTLSNFGLELKRCEIISSELGYAADLNCSENLKRVVRRLPGHVRGKWTDYADTINNIQGRKETFADLAQFVDSKARAANSVLRS